MFVYRGAIMIDVYKKCPVFEDSSYTLRMVTTDDCLDLLKSSVEIKQIHPDFSIMFLILET